MGAVHAEIKHLLKDSNVRNPGHFVFANTSMLLGGSVCENELTWICHVTFIQ